MPPRDMLQSCIEIPPRPKLSLSSLSIVVFFSHIVGFISLLHRQHYVWFYNVGCLWKLNFNLSRHKMRFSHLYLIVSSDASLSGVKLVVSGKDEISPALLEKIEKMRVDYQSILHPFYKLCMKSEVRHHLFFNVSFSFFLSVLAIEVLGFLVV